MGFFLFINLIIKCGPSATASKSLLWLWKEPLVHGAGLAVCAPLQDLSCPAFKHKDSGEKSSLRLDRTHHTSLEGSVQAATERRNWGPTVANPSCCDLARQPSRIQPAPPSAAPRRCFVTFVLIATDSLRFFFFFFSCFLFKNFAISNLMHGAGNKNPKARECGSVEICLLKQKWLFRIQEGIK